MRTLASVALPEHDTAPAVPEMRDRLADIFARGSSGLLFVLLSMNLVRDFLETRRITGLLLLVSEALVVVLIVFRRPARQVDCATTFGGRRCETW